MDGSLWTIRGRRVLPIRYDGTEMLTRAIVACYRGKAKVGLGQIQGLQYVQILGEGVNQIIRKDDWDKITPFLLVNFDPQMTPVQANGYFDPTVWFTPDLSAQQDQQLHARVLERLRALFPVRFPTSTH